MTESHRKLYVVILIRNVIGNVLILIVIDSVKKKREKWVEQMSNAHLKLSYPRYQFIGKWRQNLSVFYSISLFLFYLSPSRNRVTDNLLTCITRRYSDQQVNKNLYHKTLNTLSSLLCKWRWLRQRQRVRKKWELVNRNQLFSLKSYFFRRWIIVISAMSLQIIASINYICIPQIFFPHDTQFSFFGSLLI